MNNKLKLLQAEVNKQTVIDAIEHQKSLGMSVSYKTVKYMKKDLHNIKVLIRNLNKLIRKEDLREQSASRK